MPRLVPHFASALAARTVGWTPSSAPGPPARLSFTAWNAFGNFHNGVLTWPGSANRPFLGVQFFHPPRGPSGRFCRTVHRSLISQFTSSATDCGMRSRTYATTRPPAAFRVVLSSSGGSISSHKSGFSRRRSPTALPSHLFGRAARIGFVFSNRAPARNWLRPCRV